MSELEGQRTREGRCCGYSRTALDDLVGYVAAEANHERKRRRADLLHAGVEVEAVLARGR